MTQAGKTGIALIGAGMIGRTHVAAISDLRDRATLISVLSTRPERARPLADHYDGAAPEFTSDIADILNDPRVTMAIVATPPSVRIDLIRALAKAGKHVLLEKPVARNTQEATQVVEICEANAVTLGMVFQHRMRAPSIKALDLVRAGDLGRLGHVEIAAPLWRDQSYYDELDRGTYARDGGGVLITQAIHTIDLALSFTGPVTRVQAMTATTPLHQMEAEDFAVAGLHFANGAVGSLVASTASYPQSKEMIALHYEHATLRIGTDTLDVAWRDGRRDNFAVPTGEDTDDGPVIAKHQWHRGIIADFIDAIETNRPPIVTGRQGLLSHQLIEAIETSSRSGTPYTMP